MEFMDALKSTTGNISYTENGMQGYKTSGNVYTDFLYKVTSFRNMDVLDIRKECLDFISNLEASEDKKYLLKFIFYIRDPRNGLGERALGRELLATLLKSFDFDDKEEIFKWVVNNVHDYARWDDLIYLMQSLYFIKGETAVNNETSNKHIMMIADYLKSTLDNDLKMLDQKKPITLLAKWMPSINTSSQSSRSWAKLLITCFGWSEKQYRQTLSKLRGYLRVTERQMSLNEWEQIDYEKVPSLANLRYKDAFLKHDEKRRLEYLSKLVKGEAKINSAVNFPHDVVHKYYLSDWGCVRLHGYDEALEQLWKNLKEIPGLKDTLVVRDDSGSMTSSLGKTKITALEVATALGIYCAEHCSEVYKNKIISFSHTPKYLDFSEYTTLHDKLSFLDRYSEVANTNIRAVFQLILKTAIDNKLKQEDLPKQILIISDMEFDEGVDYIGNPIEESQMEFEKYGYQLPKLVFWNVCGRTNTIPITQNKLGAYLISGFSPNVLNIVFEGTENQFESLKKILDTIYSKVPEIG